MLRYALGDRFGGYLQYSGETAEQAAHRHRRMCAHNLRLDRLAWRNGRPMPAMREWAKRRGIEQSHAPEIPPREPPRAAIFLNRSTAQPLNAP